MNLSQSPTPAGPNSKICIHCKHPLGLAVMCGDENCPNPWTPHYHCVYTGCNSACTTLGTCRPVTKEEMTMNNDVGILNVVRFKLATDGLLAPNREDVRDVGKIRAKYGLAKQRDDEGYSDFLDRLVSSITSKEQKNGNL